MAGYNHLSEAKIRLNFQRTNPISRGVIFQFWGDLCSFQLLQLQTWTQNSNLWILASFLYLSAQVFLKRMRFRPN